MTILITGASGKTGRAVLKALARRGQVVNALAHKAESIDELLALGARQVFVGDLRSVEDLTRAMRGAQAVYHICPNVQPDELAIGSGALEAAKAAGVERFVYHSVLHPHTEGMPHHWQKLRVEEKIFESGLGFTILQPCAYMQNILANWRQITDDGVYPVPYALETRLSMVDLEDVAEAAAVALSEARHNGAIYELAGKEALTQSEVARALSTGLERPVQAAVVDRSVWERRTRASGMPDYAVETLLNMFRYYERFGLWGNSNVLEWLIGRPAHTFADFIRDQRLNDTRR